MSLGPGEILIVVVVALIVLGPDKLPTAARNIAKFYRELRNMTQSVRSQVEEVLDIDESAKNRMVDRSTPPPNPPNPDTSGFRLVDQEPLKPPPADPASFPPDFDAPEPAAPEEPVALPDPDAPSPLSPENKSL